MQSPDPNDASDNGNISAESSEHHAREFRVPTHYASNTGRYMAIGAGTLALVLVIGFAIVFAEKRKTDNSLREETARNAAAPPEVDVVTVKTAPTTQPLTLPGETQAWDQSTIYVRVSGYVDDWKVDIGDKVEKGQVLATIETPELDAKLLAAEANLKAADAQLGVEQANADFAKTTYIRWRDSPGPVVSEQERQEKKAAYDSGIAKVKAAEAQVSLNTAERDSLKALTHFKEVTAPYKGVITSRNVDIGDLVTAGSTASTTSLYHIARSDKIRVFVDVPQGASGEVKVGMSVVATTSQLPSGEFKGTVMRTANAIDPASRTLHVEADIPNDDLTLVPGMYVQVNLELTEKALVQVPASGLVFRTSGWQVAVVGADEKIQFHNVSIARDQGDFVEIDSGVAAGDKVALNISSEIENGDKVTVNDISPTLAP